MMDKQQLLQLIENALDSREHQALVLVMGGSFYQKELFKILKSYPEVSYQYILSPSSEEVPVTHIWKQIGKPIIQFEQMQSAVKSADCIILPALTKNSLAKMANGIADNLALCAVQTAFMMEKKVIACNASWSPDSENAKLNKMNQNEKYNQLLYSYKDRLCSFGMVDLPVFQMKEKLDRIFLSPALALPDQKEKKEPVISLSRVITKEDLVGKEQVKVTEDVLFTELAKEYIRSNQIKISKG